MAFYVYDISFLIIFCLAVGIFLYKKRANLKREGIMYLYRTQVGIKLINYVGNKYKKTISVFSFLAVISGYLLMLSMIYFLGDLIYIYVFKPEIVQAIKIPPIMPLVPYLPEAFKISFLPPFYFTYWIIAIAVIAVFHEFAHGIVAKRYDIKVKTTGFGFLGPFLAAFVEPDEEEMKKKPKYQQIAVLSAGTFTNLILAGIFFLILGLFFIAVYAPSGVIFNTYTPAVVNISSIGIVGGISISNPTQSSIIDLINKNQISNDLILGTNGNSINMTKIISGNKTYFSTIDDLKTQIDSKEVSDLVVLYPDFPAIEAGLRGVIIGINDEKIRDYGDLIEIIKKYKPGDKIKITTKDKEDILEYNITLAEDPAQKGRPIIGIGFVNARQGFFGKIFDFLNFFKKPQTDYEPKFNAEIIIFLYNLIWWLALINFSVALMNMLPVAIFDGGRMFMLTIWKISKSEKFAQVVFKVITYAILGCLLVLMWAWFKAMF
ncbi:MAG: site-2 protease family protein [Candidatus Nanoarchaeia archaeon]|nr:site-2 protease family protein [Candidatus Nanoarchaeia archaeon]